MNEVLDKKIESLQKEVRYYQKQIDEVSGLNLKFDIENSNLKHELKQRRQGFRLLSELSQNVGSSKDPHEVLRLAAENISRDLGMDRAIVLLPTEGNKKQVKAKFAFGFADTLHASFYEEIFEFPQTVLSGQEFLLVNKSTTVTDPISNIREKLKVPFFVCVSVIIEGELLGLILTGRIVETEALFPPLNQVDIDTLNAISALISSSIQNLKVAILEETDKLKADFFANISHEFRTPITLTVGPLESMMNNRYGVLPEEAKQQIKVVLRNQKRLLTLINQILDLAKLDSNDVQLNVARLDSFNSYIFHTTEPFKLWAENKKIKLEFDLDPSLDKADIFIDEEKFDQVILNLMSNALKFTETGTIIVQSSIVDSKVKLSITDSGVGIKEDQIKNIFKRFGQADGSKSKDQKGTGIGLTLVKDITELHGGQIEVSSKYGKGTTFTIILNTGSKHFSESVLKNLNRKCDSSSASGLKHFHIEESNNLTNEKEFVIDFNKKSYLDSRADLPTILFVDDNLDIRNYVKDLLKKYYNVYLAVNGLHGYEVAMMYKLDLILSDFMMPEMNGLEFCEKIKSNSFFEGLPFVLLTAMSDFNTKILGLNYGADDYLTKPFSEIELLARVHNLTLLRKRYLRLKTEIIAAKNIQLSLLPNPDVVFKDISLDAIYLPCEDLSGDFYDFIETDDSLYIYVADVTSHGTAAAQVTYLVKGVVKELVSTLKSPSVSDIFYNFLSSYKNFNLNYAIGFQLFKLDKKNRNCEYLRSNAPSCIFVTNNITREIEVDPSPTLDNFSEAYSKDQICTVNFKISKDDIIYLFTDGAYEFRTLNNPNMEFGTRRLAKAFSKLTAANWKKELHEFLVSISGKIDFEDDLTIIRLQSL